MNPLDSISKTTIELLLTEPFYAHFLMGLPKEISTETETIATKIKKSQPISLIINATFWENLKADHRYGLLKHEVLHIVLKHHLIGKAYSNKTLFNIATDLVVNQYIDRKQLPDSALLLEQFVYLKYMYDIDLLPHQEVAYYYHQLIKILQSKPLMPFDQAVDAGSSTLSKGNTQLKLLPILANGHPELNRHKFWTFFEDFSEGERKIIEYQVDRMIQQTIERVSHKYDNLGSLPEHLIQQLKLKLEDKPAHFNWRRMLRLFAASSNSTFLKNTIRRPSKRYGTVPGIRLKRRNRILLALDTSGSIQQEELNDFFSEIYSIWRQGTEIRVLECDSTIHSIYDYRGRPPFKIHGRGGTSFEAPLQYGNDTYHPDALIYFTDGFADIPKTNPRFPVLWMISSNGLSQSAKEWDQLPGRVFKITN